MSDFVGKTGFAVIYLLSQAFYRFSLVWRWLVRSKGRGEKKFYVVLVVKAYGE
jgi:hypothetical protein